MPALRSIRTRSPVSSRASPPPVAASELDAHWPADVSRDRLIGDVFLYQRRGGHRTGTDDVRIPKTRDEQLALIAKLKGTRGLGALREADGELRGGDGAALTTRGKRLVGVVIAFNILGERLAQRDEARR